jgi:hypothetical protein
VDGGGWWWIVQAPAETVRIVQYGIVGTLQFGKWQKGIEKEGFDRDMGRAGLVSVL